MIKKKKRGRSGIRKLWIAFVFLLVFSGSPIHVYGEHNNEEPSGLYAKAAVLMDAENFRVLYGKNEEQLLPNASTTKILTCILILERMNLEDYAVVSAYASSMPKVKLGVREGEYYQIKDLLYSLMLESHNDSAVVLAEALSGSVEQFAVMMNQKAKEIGCTDTYFITPNGLDAADGEQEHHTTAKDLAKILSYCVTVSPKKDEFIKITGTMEYSFTNYEKTEKDMAAGSRSYSCLNHNRLLSMREDVISGKTGYTSKAGYCYVSAAKQENRVLVLALLGCGWPSHREYKWEDAKKLLDYGFSHYKKEDLYDKKYERFSLHPIQISNGRQKQLMPQQMVFENSQNTEFLIGTNDVLSIRLQQKKTMEAPVRKGETVGRILYYLNGEKILERRVFSYKEIKKIDFFYVEKQVFQKYLKKS